MLLCTKAFAGLYMVGCMDLGMTLEEALEIIRINWESNHGALDETPE